MSSRGRQQRANAVGNSPSGLNSRSGNANRSLISSTRSSSGSPSSRTRSLAITASPSSSKKQVLKKMSVKSSPNKSSGNSSPSSSSSPAQVGVAKRRNSADEGSKRKSRRPKFQDNPPAPEIVEKKALQLAEQQEASRFSENQDDEDEEDIEEEVDDDEDAAVRAASEASGCDHDNLASSSNGVIISNHEDDIGSTNNGASPSKKRTHQDILNNDVTTNGNDEDDDESNAKKAKLSISDSVSSLVDDIVKQIDTEPLAVKEEETNNEDKTDEEEEELEDDQLMINGDKNESLLHKQLVEAVKDLSDPSEIKECLIKTLKVTLANDPNAGSVKNPTETFTDIVAESSVDGEVRTSVVDELVSTYHQMISTELKMEADESSIVSTDSFPPELVPQVDGVDSSAEGGGKSDADHKEQEDNKQHELNMDSNEEEEDDECDEMKTAIKCDKSKILSEMENKFAKETQNALKNRPAYKRRNKSESWDLSNGKDSDQEDHQPRIIMMKEPGELEVAATEASNTANVVEDDEHAIKDKDNDENNPNTSSSTLKTLRKFRKGTRHPSFSSDASHISDHLPSNSDQDQDQGPPMITKNIINSPSKRMAMSPPPTLTPEVGPSSSLIIPSPLRIDIPDHYQHSPSSSSYSAGGYSRRLVIRTPPAARSGLSTIMSEAVLSKEDAEVAATAVQLTPPVIVPVSSLLKPEEHPSLKIRLPKNGSGPSLVITSNSASSAAAASATAAATTSAISQSTPHHKKVPKRRNLQNESDGGLDTEEEEPIDVYRKSKNKNIKSFQEQQHEHDKLSADEDASEMLGGKATPDSQITSDDRQAIMVPEKASSFNIHPERTCSDCCFYCRQKFGLFDTPLHISQMKSLEIQKFAIEYSNCSKDACLCDKCYRLVDRNARNMKKESEGENLSTTEKVRSCFVRNCNKEVTHTVGKKWLHRLKKRLIKKLNTDWDRIAKASMKSSFPVCNKHNNIIEYYSNCGLCKKKLSVNAICCLRMNKVEVQELNDLLRADSIPAGLAETMFVCKLCKTFCGIKQKAALEPDYLKNHKNHKLFMKEHKRRLYSCLGLDSTVQEDMLASPDSTNTSPASSGAKTQKKIHQVSQSDNPTKITIKTFEVPTNHHPDRPSRKRRQKEFASPNSDSRIFVVSHDSTTGKPDQDTLKVSSKSSSGSGSSSSTSQKSSQDNSSDASSSSAQVDRLPMCSITISFDLNTQKLWDDLHLPYETYTSFFRHLILLEKYFRNGDLVLSDNASLKASSYVRSLQNRIEEYEVKHKRSHADLSASTRPDLSVPPAPSVLDLSLGPIIEPPTTRNRASAEREPSPVQSSKKADDNSTILRIPKVSMPSSSTSEAPAASSTVTSPPPPNMPTKIRVRDDLMYIGLMAKGKEGQEERPTTTDRKKPSSSQQPQNLMQLLSDPTLKQKASSSSSSNKGPTLGKTSLVANNSSSKSSNSQLFKNSETSSSSAIPLTFNNSIAEVLAAAAKSKSMNTDNLPKPEVTITPKNKNQPTWSSSDNVKKSSPATLSTTPSGGGNAKVNPLIDMSKLLQSQAPAIPPHIVAQNTLTMPTTATTSKPISTHQMAGTMPKIAPKPTSSLLKPVLSSMHSSKHGPSSSVGQGPKKSLNTVLDRLSGLKSTIPASSSSLVQQLQAPPIMANPGMSSPSKNRPVTSQQPPSSASSSASLAGMQNLQTLLASGGLLGMGYPGSSSSMVQYPWASPNNQAQQAAMAEAQRALTMAGAGLPGMNQAAAAAALNEIFKLSLQQAGAAAAAGVQPPPSSGQQPPRPRAPPPLTLMGRAGNHPPKPHKPD